MIDALLKVGVFVVLVEALVLTLTLPLTIRWPALPNWIKQAIAVTVAMASCFVFSVDVFGAIGFTSAHPAIGKMLTGLIVTRGSNFWHDIAARFAPPKVPAAPPSPGLRR